MEAIIPYIWPTVLTILGFLVFAFLYPFLRSIWIRPLMLLWGFYLGGRRRRNVEREINHKDDPSTSREKINEFIQNAIQGEEDSIKELHDEQKTHFENRVTDLETRINKHEQNFKNWRQRVPESFIGKKFSSVDENLRTVKLKNIVLLVAVISIIYIDALIARHVFVSLGLFTNETLTIFGREFPGGYPKLYGAFITAALAIFLHVALKRESLQVFFFEQRWGRNLVIIIIALLFILLLGAVLVPDSAKELMEIAMRVSWALGVIIVYWLGSKIIGENENYAELILPVTIVLLLLGWVVVGAGFILELFLGKIYDIFTNILLSPNKTRLKKKHDNELVRYQAIRQGFRRGFNF